MRRSTQKTGRKHAATKLPELGIIYIGGPTALLQFGGLRMLTDPAFDPAGHEYHLPGYTLRKTAGPAVSAAKLQPVDIVLLSHDHHFDNLDVSGRGMLESAERILTTRAGAARLGMRASGLAAWQSIDVPAPGGHILRITGTPARHGPAGADRGPVTGFVLYFTDAPQHVLYISGDTVWFEGLAEISTRYPIKAAILFMGAARVRAAGPAHLTLTAEEGIRFARVNPGARIIPMHFEGWTHYSESKTTIARSFARAGMKSRLRWLRRGRKTLIAV